MKKIKIGVITILIFISSFFLIKKQQYTQLVKQEMSQYTDSHIVDSQEIDNTKLSYQWINNQYIYQIKLKKTDKTTYITLHYDVPQTILTSVFQPSVKPFQPNIYTHFNGKTIDFDNQLTIDVFKNISFKHSFSSK